MPGESKPVKLASMWRNDKNNRLVASGTIDGRTRVLLFKTNPEWKAENPNRPDFELCVAESDKKDSDAKKDEGGDDFDF